MSRTYTVEEASAILDLHIQKEAELLWTETDDTRTITHLSIR